MTELPARPPGHRWSDPDSALRALVERLTPRVMESVTWQAAAGRILAQPFHADRDSPAYDVSAMDGYAVRLADLDQDMLAVSGEVAMGVAPPPLPLRRALRIFTGCPIPDGAEAVIRRENVEELGDAIRVRSKAASRAGQDIRRRGENVAQGAKILDAGRVIDAAVLGAAVTFGLDSLSVYRKLRTSVIVTGNEVRGVGENVQPWELRDSNGPGLWALMATLPWLEPPTLARAPDDLASITRAVSVALSQSDVIILTGGVSMGDHDHVPEAVHRAGCESVFHKLPIRPGHPVLGAIGPANQAVFGLPGNPVSVLVTTRRFVVPALRRMAGMTGGLDVTASSVRLNDPDNSTAGLWWYRPVRLIGLGDATLIASRGSGDVVSAARSDGFIEVPPNQAGPGPWLYWPWSWTS